VNAQTERQLIAGPAGALECAIDLPPAAPVGLAVICHPHPQHGGTLDNKVAQTLVEMVRGGISVFFDDHRHHPKLTAIYLHNRHQQ